MKTIFVIAEDESTLYCYQLFDEDNSHILPITLYFGTFLIVIWWYWLGIFASPVRGQWS